MSKHSAISYRYPYDVPGSLYFMEIAGVELKRDKLLAELHELSSNLHRVGSRRRLKDRPKIAKLWQECRVLARQIEEADRMAGDSRPFNAEMYCAGSK